jgi:hypothetical protein
MAVGIGQVDAGLADRGEPAGEAQAALATFFGDDDRAVERLFLVYRGFGARRPTG